jgi:hypothetical protein
MGAAAAASTGREVVVAAAGRVTAGLRGIADECDEKSRGGFGNII